MIGRMTGSALAILLALLLAFTGDALAQGCAMCGTATTPDDPLARAFNWSILFLIAMPYTLCGLVGGWLAYRYRRSAAARRGDVIALPWVRRSPAPADGPKEA
jgi:hypothetical protein